MNTNYERFFRIPESLRDEHLKLPSWSGIDAEADIGPVHTNFPSSGIDIIRIMAICESPSEDEVRLGRPTVGNTGTKLFNRLADAGTVRSLTRKYHPSNFDDYWEMFTVQGVYITNLVCCQADYGIKGTAPVLKDRRVEEAWPLNRDRLLAEIACVQERFPGTPVLFACGSRFKNQVREIAEELEHRGIPWSATSHPSRCPARYSEDFNPVNWNDPEYLPGPKYAQDIFKMIKADR